jgi:hypothetical protein
MKSLIEYSCKLWGEYQLQPFKDFMKQNQRQPGQYWVIFKGVPKWTIALWQNNAWIVAPYTNTWTDDSMEEIDETPVIRESKPRKPEYPHISAHTGGRDSVSYTPQEMMAKGINRFTELMEAQIAQTDTTREATLQLSYQVERIANALEGSESQQQPEPSITVDYLQRMWKTLSKEQFLDRIIFLISGVDKSTLHLMLSDPTRSVEVVKYQVYRDGGTVEYRDIHNRAYFVPAAVYEDSNIYSENPYSLSKSREYRDSIRLKNLSLKIVDMFNTPDTDHPDYKGALGT